MKTLKLDEMTGTAYVNMGDKCSKINETKRHRLCVGLEIQLDKQLEKPHLTIFRFCEKRKRPTGNEIRNDNNNIIITL